MEELTFRRVAPSDGALLYGFFRSLSGESVNLLTRESISAASAERRCREQASPDGRDSGYLLLSKAGKAIGYAELKDREHPVPELRIAVADAYAGNGYGLYFLDRIRDEIVREGRCGLRASFPARNMRVHRLLGLHGFRQEGLTPEGDLLLMWETPAEPCVRLPSPDREVTLRSGRRVLLRSVRPGDGEKLEAFFKVMDGQSRAFFTPHDLSREYLDGIASADGPDFDRFVAEDCVDGHLVGYFFLSRLTRQIPSMGIGSLAEVQGEGMGRAMMELLTGRAAAYGKRVMRLITHSTNYRAQKLYKTFGFSQVGVSVNGELLMLCPLDQY